MGAKSPKPYKATPTTIKIILDAIADGLTQRDASILAGISEEEWGQVPFSRLSALRKMNVTL